MTRKLPLPGIVLNSDVIGSSAGGHPRHADLADATEAVLGDAIATAPVPDAWVRSSRGDGEVSVAPASVPAAWLLADFLNTVYAGIVGYNRNKRTGDRLRLRVGIDCGDVLIDGRSEPRGGDPLVLAARLQSSTAAREASAAVPDAPLVVVVSDEIYRRVVPHRDKGLRPEEFREVTVDGADGPVVAWLYVPHYPPPSVGGAARKKPKHRSEPPPSKYKVKIYESDNIRVGDQLGGER